MCLKTKFIKINMRTFIQVPDAFSYENALLAEFCVSWLLGKMHYKTFLGLHLNIKQLMKYLAILSGFKQIAFYVPRESSKTWSGKHTCFFNFFVCLFGFTFVFICLRKVRWSESYLLTFLLFTLKVLLLLFLEAISYKHGSFCGPWQCEDQI